MVNRSLNIKQRPGHACSMSIQIRIKLNFLRRLSDQQTESISMNI